MLKTSLSYFRQRISFIKKSMEEATSTITEQVVEKRPEDDSVNEQSSVKKQKTEQDDVQKISKRKYALLIGYSGEGYFGLQR